jgi:predicted SAM-dependent methyltransferase
MLRSCTFVHHDLAYGIPLDDASADYVFSSHFLEHLFLREGEHLLRECYRVLLPGGMVRIAVPDLEYALSLYAQGEKEKMLLNYFFVEDMESHYARHKYMYDFAMLKALLESIGFREIERCRYREGLTPNLEVLDNRPEETLFVEARK